MPRLIREIVNTVEDTEGRSHIACVYADERDDGMWDGSVVFFPTGGGETLRAKHESSQPNLQDLEYWAAGLTYYFLEGALARAKATEEKAYRALERPSGKPGEHVPHAAVPLTLSTPDDGVLSRVFRNPSPEPGTRRDLEGGGVLVYERSRTVDGGSPAHDLSIQLGSRNAAAIAANWLYSHLSGEGVGLQVRGRPTEVRNDAIRDALLEGADRLR